MATKVLMFPGQGAQYKGMGKEVFNLYPDLTQEASARLGFDLVDLCLNNRDNLLDRTDYTQPALYFVNALSALQKAPDVPYCIGHSLGEYNALLYAGVFDLFTGLELVKKRATLMHQCAQGAMAVVQGKSPSELQNQIEIFGFNNIHVANANSATQVVVSGDREQLAQLLAVLTKNTKTKAFLLKTSGAFHSPYMKPAVAAFNDYLSDRTFNAPEKIVISNFTASPYTALNLKENLANQIAGRVRWHDSINYLLNTGLEPDQFQEVGNTEFLTKLLADIALETA
ncbi:ACP S-malonyltransferase [Reinekea sp. G2M2-21]|uniref:ACP S-malonyltransferase n=1 Tax=Reinekea sp. G2M2-21 TaxID=2788942 RepID=UPI0018A9F9B4|nr:ACP S-malonyltransferase [Reinekea sp. G2M2-21]